MLVLGTGVGHICGTGSLLYNSTFIALIGHQSCKLILKDED